MTTDEFSTLLSGVCKTANINIIAAAGAPADPALVEEQRAMWHAAEVALGILDPGYVPKQATFADVVDLLGRFSPGLPYEYPLSERARDVVLAILRDDQFATRRSESVTPMATAFIVAFAEELSSEGRARLVRSGCTVGMESGPATVQRGDNQPEQFGRRRTVVRVPARDADEAREQVITALGRTPDGLSVLAEVMGEEDDGVSRPWFSLSDEIELEIEWEDD